MEFVSFILNVSQHYLDFFQETKRIVDWRSSKWFSILQQHKSDLPQRMLTKKEKSCESQIKILIQIRLKRRYKVTISPLLWCLGLTVPETEVRIETSNVYSMISVEKAHRQFLSHSCKTVQIKNERRAKKNSSATAKRERKKGSEEEKVRPGEK